LRDAQSVLNSPREPLIHQHLIQIPTAVYDLLTVVVFVWDEYVRDVAIVGVGFGGDTDQLETFESGFDEGFRPFAVPSSGVSIPRRRIRSPKLANTFKVEGWVPRIRLKKVEFLSGQLLCVLRKLFQTTTESRGGAMHSKILQLSFVFLIECLPHKKVQLS